MFIDAFMHFKMQVRSFVFIGNYVYVVTDVMILFFSSFVGGSNLPKAESKSKENEVKDPLPKDTTLSPPKSVNTDIIHKKKQLKTPNATAIGASKFGRWVPVRSLSGNFTPRPILHRSLSDSSSFEKAKTTSHKKEVKRQMSVQVDSTIQNG